MKIFNLFKRKALIKNVETTTLDHIIGGEICGDQFYDLLKSYASRLDLKLFLEIGSSAGGGSTQAFVDAISKRSDSDHVSVYCFELSKNRFKLLAETYNAFPFIKPYNVSSISTDEFPEVSSVTKFYQNVKSSLNAYPIETILQWYWQDINYIKNSGLDQNGILHVKEINHINVFDMVLIDGSEFTGEVELNFVIGSKVIALDDINTFKCYDAFNKLSADSNYVLKHSNRKLRNGYAIFEKI
jgi:hypothetical protein